MKEAKLVGLKKNSARITSGINIETNNTKKTTNLSVMTQTPKKPRKN